MANNTISCQICGAQVHSIQLHIKNDHPETTLEEYEAEYPDAPLLSEVAAKRIQEAEAPKSAQVVQMPKKTGMFPMAEIFNIDPSDPGVNSSKGTPINISVYEPDAVSDYIPKQDGNYVWDVDLLKTILMGLELNMPIMLWGHAGTGKTTAPEQICAATNRPLIRVQHTANAAESDIVGQWTVRNGETIFELGPLPYAMKHGLVYLADEYDFSYPSILSVYQPVLEGKALLIKEADHANRIIQPHPNFRFVATGNTNGSGDEEGIYQGTVLQNAANYSRFAITYQVKYMAKNLEIAVIAKQGSVVINDAKMLRSWAEEIRKAHDDRRMGATVGPRELIHAAIIGSRKSSMREGIKLAITNRMSSIDREIADEVAQRIIQF